MRLFTVVLALTSSHAVAADAPDAQALIAESSKALFHQQPFRMRMHMDMQMQMQGAMNQTIALDMKLAVAPGRFRMDATPMPMDSTLVSDGQFTWFYVGAMKKYTKKPAAGSPEALAESVMPGASSMTGMLKDLTSARVAREETLDVGGLKRDCYVVEFTVDKFSVSSPVPTTLRNVHQTMWIDKERKLTLKQIGDFEMQLGGPSAPPARAHQEIAVTALDLAPAFAADEFTFTPPEGAVEVDSLPGMPKS